MRCARTVARSLIAVLVVILAGSAVGAGQPGEHRRAVIPASAVTPADTTHTTDTAHTVVPADRARSGSWGYVTEPTPAYAREIGPGPGQEPTAYVYPAALNSEVFAYCKTPLPGTSRFQYHAAVPADPDAFTSTYRMAWIPGGTMTFTKLTSIPRC